MTVTEAVDLIVTFARKTSEGSNVEKCTNGLQCGIYAHESHHHHHHQYQQQKNISAALLNHSVIKRECKLDEDEQRSQDNQGSQVEDRNSEKSACAPEKSSRRYFHPSSKVKLNKLTIPHAYKESITEIEDETPEYLEIKRRVYDIIHIFQAVGLLRSVKAVGNSNSFIWAGCDVREVRNLHISQGAKENF